jgi:plasmid maintenance system killer protein
MKIKELRDDLVKYLKRHKLADKFNNAKQLFEANPLYPSLHVELLEPRHRLIYSFRLERKYRALFIYSGENEIEIIAFTNHYK